MAGRWTVAKRTYGEGSVTKYDSAKGTRWTIRYRVEVDGEQKRMQERGFTTKAEAEKALRKRLSDRDSGAFVPPTADTFREYADQWLIRRAPERDQSTTDWYSRYLRLHVHPRIGDVRLQALTAQRLEAMYSDLLRTGRKDHKEGTGLSGKTVGHIHTMVKSILGDAVEKGVLQRNVALSARPALPKTEKQIQTWTTEQVQAFLVAQEGTRLGPLWRLYVMTGMRRGEALGLAWSQIDWDKSQLRVERCLKDVHWGQPVFGPPKTEASRRTVTLDPGTLAALRSLRTEQARERLLHGEGYTDYDLVFCKPDGNPLHPDRTLRKFKDLAAQCGLPVIRLHDTRHTNATLLLETGIQSHVVQKRLGHSHVSITLSTYAHVTKTMDDEAANRIASLIG